MTQDHPADHLRRGRLAGKVAVITGGCAGMGRATVDLFLAEGARVAIGDLRDDLGAALEREHPGLVRYWHCDVREDADVAALCRGAAEAFGAIDILFNNAGYAGMREGVEGMNAAGWDDVFAGNARGPALGMHHALPFMKERGGSIINVGSTAGLQAGHGGFAYSAAKAAVIHMTRWAAGDLARFNIRVNSISPGLIVTSILGTTQGWSPEEADRIAQSGALAAAAATIQPVAKAGMPGDIAEAVLFLASDASAFITGTNIVVDGGITIGPKHSWDPEFPSLFGAMRDVVSRGG